MDRGRKILTENTCEILIRSAGISQRYQSLLTAMSTIMFLMKVGGLSPLQFSLRPESYTLNISMVSRL